MNKEELQLAIDAAHEALDYMDVAYARDETGECRELSIRMISYRILIGILEEYRDAEEVTPDPERLIERHEKLIALKDKIIASQERTIEANTESIKTQDETIECYKTALNRATLFGDKEP